MRNTIFEFKTMLAQPAIRKSADALRTAESVPAPALRHLQDSRMVKMVQHAFTTTDYYRERFTAAGFTEKDLSIAGSLVHLPRLTKEDLRQAGDAIFSRAVSDRRRLLSLTGGSTGIPLRVFNDRAAPTAAMWWRVYRWWGIHPGDDVAFIYRQSRRGLGALRYAARWWPTRHLLLDARNTDDQAIEQFLRRWQRQRPRLLVGYVEGVYDFARYLRRTGSTIHPPRAISVTASGLHPGQRKFIEATLNAPVYDTYRSAEIPWIAAECQQQAGLHVQSDLRRLEVVTQDNAPAGAGMSADVVLTDLANFAFPLIRYEIGDRARTLPGLCGCGNSLPRISALEGRHADVVHTPSGRRISGGYGGLFNQWPHSVHQFQIHQSVDYTITVRFVPSSDRAAAADAARSVAAVISGFVNDEVPVRTEPVDRIDQYGGKARLVISEAVPDMYATESRYE